MMLRRLGAFLFIAAFGFATVQSATAQDDEDNHLVTIDVQDITELSISGDVTLTFSSANGEDNVSQFSGGNIFASASSTTSYEIQTNRDEVSLEVSLGGTSKFDEDEDELGLSVIAETGDDEGDGEENLKLTGLGEGNGFISGAETLDDDFGPLSESGLNLEYEGVITEEFAKNDGENLRITYTVTGN